MTVINTYVISLFVGVIQVFQALDREATPKGYLLHVIATDKGYPTSHSSTVTTQVNISDVNDNFPQFDSDVYTATLVEEQNGTTVIAQISATDADEGNNGRISYSITG